MCFVGNGISRGALLNKGPYKVPTRNDLCTTKFGESSNATDSSRTTSSVETQEESETNSFTDINYNNAIFDVTKASLTAPLKAKIWSNVNQEVLTIDGIRQFLSFMTSQFKTTLHCCENSSWDG